MSLVRYKPMSSARELMNVDNISVVIADGLIPTLHQNFTLYDNGTHRWIYIAYPHSTHEIVITPEFSPFLILPLSMIVTLLAAIVYRREERELSAFSPILLTLLLADMRAKPCRSSSNR